MQYGAMNHPIKPLPAEIAEIGELGFDSLSILDLIYDVQQEFGIEFDAEELVNVNTVGDLADFIAEETKA